VLKAFFSGPQTHLPQPADFVSYEGFLDARIRYARVAEVLQTIDPLTLEQVRDPGLIPGDAPVREFIGGSTIQIPHNE
jgi:hypothetical protein